MKFKALLKQSEVNQRKLAQELNVTQSLISQWCSGKCEPKIGQLWDLTRILDVDLGDLVDCFTPEKSCEVEA